MARILSVRVNIQIYDREYCECRQRTICVTFGLQKVTADSSTALVNYSKIILQKYTKIMDSRIIFKKYEMFKMFSRLVFF